MAATHRAACRDSLGSWPSGPPHAMASRVVMRQPEQCTGGQDCNCSALAAAGGWRTASHALRPTLELPPACGLLYPRNRGRGSLCPSCPFPPRRQQPRLQRQPMSSLCRAPNNLPLSHSTRSPWQIQFPPMPNSHRQVPQPASPSREHRRRNPRKVVRPVPVARCERYYPWAPA